MTGASSGCSDKSGKKDEFASSLNRNSSLKIKHEILKENYETLKIDYESLQERVKLSEEAYEVMKKLSQSKNEGLEVKNARLVEKCVRERSENDKYKKMLEEMKRVEREKKTTIDELRKEEKELLMAKRKRKEDVEKLENKFVALAERFVVVEADCSYLKSLYDAEVAASGLGETEKVISHGGNEVKNDVTDSIMISDEGDDEHIDPPRESNIISQPSVDPCKNQEQQPFSASSSSSSSSDGYDVVFKLPGNWPDWAIPKGPGVDSSKA